MYIARVVNSICPSSFYACGRSCRVDKVYLFIYMYKAQAVNCSYPKGFYARSGSCRVDKVYYIINIRVIFIYTYKARAVNGICPSSFYACGRSCRVDNNIYLNVLSTGSERQLPQRFLCLRRILQGGERRTSGALPGCLSAFQVSKGTVSRDFC